MEEQQRVSDFIEKYGLEAPPEFRLLDLVSELGEVAKDTTESSEYGNNSAQLDVKTDEIGDVLFALLAVADSMDIDASEALEEALTKYEARLEEKGVLPQENSVEVNGSFLSI